MYYFAFLFCTFLVPLTQSFTVVNKVEDDFSIDDETDYEVVPVRHMLHKRSINELTLHTKINGVEREIYLQPTEGLLAGTGTKVFIAKRGSQRNVDFKIIPNIMQNVFINFYQDQKTSSSISHSINKRGLSEFNGIINENMVIRPMPEHLRKRRDLLKSNTSSFESLADGFIDTTEHIIYKQTFNNASEFSAPTMNNDRFLNMKSVSRRSVDELPYIVYPEILVFVDDLLFKKFEFNVIRAVEYTLSFWNAVDLRYREFTEPKIRLNIAGIVFLEEPLPFIYDANGVSNGGKVSAELLLDEFSEFLQKEKVIQQEKNYDISMLVTGRDVIGASGSSDVVGLANVEGVCKNGKNYPAYVSSGLTEDRNGYNGIITAAHELAHILGAHHDEPEASDNINADRIKGCKKADGYMMTHNHETKNKIFFSPCSKEAIKITLSQNIAQCVRNNPAEYKNNNPLPRILPGQLMSFNEQCRNRGFIESGSKTTCLVLWCVYEKEGEDIYSRTEHFPPAEGSSCGNGKYCLSGECVDIVNTVSKKQNPKPVPKKSSKSSTMFASPKKPVIQNEPVGSSKPFSSKNPFPPSVKPTHTIRVK
ncbi:A disintegrin and metalloproteinase with thrombospondin motifs 16-like [Leptopilina heterotoma]|uniref:A disintegrin and metalloproteinase with thrombospondin motifs 16-like n=1 Tax=Leptopilina heterotoma TaxID=63436 RepID=UPI001CAA2C40|nr:A disintegrin and metalloproteinase with thrombospondin motifs 16-like [Leptopilina heterotoma]